jgi:hypothetical protein
VLRRDRRPVGDWGGYLRSREEYICLGNYCRPAHAPYPPTAASGMNRQSGMEGELGGVGYRGVLSGLHLETSFIRGR